MAMKKEALTNLIADDLDKRNENWTEIDNTFALKANKQQEAWITPTLLNGATGTIQYRKNEMGRVEFLGRITIPTNHVDGFVLPANYRPESNLNLHLSATDSSVVSCAIFTSGGLRVTNGAEKTIILGTLSYARL